MRSFAFITTFVASAGLVICSGCASVAKTKDERPAAARQLQHTAMMSAGRYTQILDGLEAGKIEETKKNLDWWLDQEIMDLALLEESYPQGQWGEVTVDRDSELKAKAFYRKIAQYRKNHPRLHSVPLEPAQRRLIDAFVEKYQ
jgi:hypothetical protein